MVKERLGLPKDQTIVFNVHRCAENFDWISFFYVSYAQGGQGKEWNWPQEHDQADCVTFWGVEEYYMSHGKLYIGRHGVICPLLNLDLINHHIHCLFEIVVCMKFFKHICNLDLGVSHLSFTFVGAKNAQQINFVVFKYKWPLIDWTTEETASLPFALKPGQVQTRVPLLRFYSVLLRFHTMHYG